ncbi:MAG: succinate dehydrogenase flavoprotein subunit [Gammaproteobacteria bacterium AqS3]|nr:succinate dehydrogenase flavoprotein subunit [Gammaproteobacteria bacterium AqS3]
MSVKTEDFDALIIGGGGAGLRAALQLAQSGLNTAVVSKVFPTRSHTVSAQGGITCAIQSDDPDDRWQWHMYDTVKGSDYIGDQEAIEYMCREGPKAVYELEHIGLPFSRNPDGRIYQRPFGGQSRDFGRGGQAARTCAAADRTGHALLHTLYQANLKAGARFLNEWFAVDLIVSGASGAVCGVVAIDIATGDVTALRSRVTVLATGGAGRIYQSTTNAHINTGDGMGMALRAGYPAQDMEMWQFHPTGIHGAGVLVTEGCRGEGGYLINRDGERFMERYAPNALDLASRDVVARSMVLEMLDGRGCGENSDHVMLKLDHLGEDVLNARLPGICELSKTFAHVDPARAPIPVVPTCHYMMGGIPTNIHGQALQVDDEKGDSVIDGLYAAGEVACVSVHGANRLGGNSLLDLIVFGRAAGLHIEEHNRSGDLPEANFSEEDLAPALERLGRLERQTGESVSQVREELQRIMQNHFGVFREGDFMREGIAKLDTLRGALDNLAVSDTSKVFNTARIEAIELQNLFEVAYATAISAERREESRGAHARNDFTERDDENWLAHSVYHPETRTLGRRSVNFDLNHIESDEREWFEPQQRTY